MPKSPSRSPIRHARLGRPGRVGLAMLVLALLLAQALGQLHRVWHDTTGGAGTRAQQGEAHAVLGVSCHPGPDDARAHGHAIAMANAHCHAPGLAHGHERSLADDRIPSHSQGSAECRLLDQLAQVDALPGSALPTLPGLLPAEHGDCPPCAARGRHSAVYEARAPPDGLGADPAATIG